MIQVNQAIITEQIILSEMQYHPADSQREAMIKAAESLIISELLRQRAKALDLVVKHDDENASDDDFLEALIAHEVAIPKATIKECEHYFLQNQKRFTSSPILEVQHILLAAEPSDDEARILAKLDAEQAIIRLTMGADFAELAAKLSACPSKSEGGDLGQISRGQTVPEFERQLLLGSVGLMAKPIETRYGFHVVKINRITPGNPLMFAEVQENIASYLNEKVKRKAIAQYIQQLIADAEIEGYDFNVDKTALVQ
jgi:peptidyl-prolyl cis-trans isomerase C